MGYPVQNIGSVFKLNGLAFRGLLVMMHTDCETCTCMRCTCLVLPVWRRPSWIYDLRFHGTASGLFTFIFNLKNDWLVAVHKLRNATFYSF